MYQGDTMKLTPQKKRDRLRQIEVLVADPDPRISRLVKHVLENFGFRNIHIVKNGHDALEMLRHKPLDLVITEWPMEPVDGMNFVSFVRSDASLPNRDIPIIMLTGKAELPDVETARDAGVTEFVVKPFNANTLSHRIIQVIDHPRSFIVSKHFVGPDRRRRATSGSDSDERRTPQDVLAKTAVKKQDRVIYTVNGQEVVVYHPDRSLKQMLGADLTAEQLFDEEIVREAQEVIMNLKQDFVGWVTIDISRLEHLFQALSAQNDDHHALNELTQLALVIKSQAGTFGYDFATLIGKSLYNFSSALMQVDTAALLIIRKHIDTLYVIFQKEIAGSGPDIGEEVLTGLKALTEKYFKSNAPHS